MTRTAPSWTSWNARLTCGLPMKWSAPGGLRPVLFNTAGVSAFGPPRRRHSTTTTGSLGVNLGGVINGMLTFIPRMIKAAKGGHIVSTASLGGFQGLEAALIYCASKAAVISLMEGYRPALQSIWYWRFSPVSRQHQIQHGALRRYAAVAPSEDRLPGE